MKWNKFLAIFLVMACLFALPAFAGDQVKDGAFEFGNLEIVYCATSEIPCPSDKIKGQEIAHNALGNDGAQQILAVYLQAGSAPTNFYLGLTDSTTPCSIAYADTLATVVGYGEPSGNGYARQLINRDGTAAGWPTLVATSPGYQATSKTVTFTASGGSIGPVYCAFLTDVVSGTAGKHIAFLALSQARTLANGETLQVTYNLKIQ